MKKRIALICQNVLVALYVALFLSVLAFGVTLEFVAIRKLFGNVAMYSAIGVGVVIGFMVYAAAKWDK